MTRARDLAKFIQFVENDGQITSSGIDGGITFNSVVSRLNAGVDLPTSGNTVGDLVYHTDTSSFYFWDGSDWNAITTT